MNLIVRRIGYSILFWTSFRLGILLDPWMFPIKGEELAGNISQPLLFINTQTFHLAINVEAMSKLIDGDRTEMYTIK